MKKVILLFPLLLFTYCSGSSESTTSTTETEENSQRIEQQSQENSQTEENNQNTAQSAEESNANSNEKQESINLYNLPDVKEFIENKSDRFIVDFEDIVAAHPYVGSRSPKPHNDLQVYFSNSDPRWVNAT